MEITKNKPVLAAAGLLIVAVVAWLAFGFFGIQTAFIDNQVDDADPFATEVRESDEFQDAMAEADANPTTAADGEPEMAEAIQTLFTGDFEENLINGYEVMGTAQVLTDGDQRFLRLEDFNSPNGPDLKVYLRAENGDFISLGDLRGNIGDQNYEIPAEVDLDVFNSVDIWCERFSVGFGLASLS